MFKALMSKITGAPAPSPVKKAEGRKEAPRTPPMRPQEEALLRAIEEKRKTDSLIGAKIGSKEVVQRLLSGMKTERGVHIESLLCALGSLAGYACQADLRQQAKKQGMAETSLLMVVGTKDGKNFFFGDHLNKALAESQLSIWSLAAGAAQHNGCTKLPDVAEIFGYVTGTVGGESFGIPRLPDGHKPGDLPINYLKSLWPVMLNVIHPFCKESVEWPILFGFAIQEVMDLSKTAIKPDLALQVVMESAIPMSKVDLSSY
ncbi:hypothetical protein SAMN05216350_106214 [Polaromonas sp. YR568]|uniref:hypothetical protein n=1 Tax=Polaromonas sp. YR568 TaxID=1855301 RepID=UPI0008EB8F6C|nr:hypothetical protein [Polaromonas sp. YR568]SFU85505.1 hypothetical protein SAMN05216350_106214 [Polaromonas sp. YR568]